MENPTTNSEFYTEGTKPRRGFLNFISWSSVFAGLIIAFIFQFLLTLLGISIGLATVNPLSQEYPMEGLGIGAIIWWVVTVLLSLFTGGWVAGKFAGAINTYSKVFHGILTWGLYTILSFYLLTTAIGGIISGVGSVIGKTLAIAGEGVSEMGPVIGAQLEQRGITLETIQQEVELLLKQSGISETITTTGGQMESAPEIAQAFREYRKSAGNVDRENLINIIVARTGKSRAEAEAQIDHLEGRIDEITMQAEEKARLAGDRVAKGVSRAAIITFFALIVGAIAAAFGAGIAKREYDVTDKKIIV
ncbi:MAG: hypothetical protein H0V01_08325 [Bacteroidetes bacterium]|nr:hypothetical protein [Bacteroidota bacterium]HET6243713.1 hypothetical protein [Bacteroidia bacterium]